MINIRILISIFIIVHFIFGLKAQSLQMGHPVSELFSYEINDFKGIDKDEYNRIYFINGNEIVRFHGYYDVIHSDKKPLETIKIFDGDKLIGTEDSYGKIRLDSINNYTFRKKFDKVDDRVTHIARSSYGEFILSKNTVFHFDENVARKYTFPGIVDFLSEVNGTTIIHDDENGLSIFVNGRFKIVNNSLFLARENVVDIKSINVGEYIVATKENGLFIFDGENFIPYATSTIENEKIKSLEIIKRKDREFEVVVLTENNELISMDRSGFLLFKKSYNSKVYDLLYVENELLYVVTQLGIEVFFYTLPFQVVDFTNDPIHGPISIYKNKIYWGSVDGLSYKEIDELNQLSSKKVIVKDTEGKVGKLDIVQNTLLMSHADGLYDILPKIGARFIPDEKFFNFTEISDDYLIAFGKRNNYLLKLVRGKWNVQSTLDNLPIHPKSIVLDKEGYLWLVDRDYNLMQYSFNSRELYFDEISRERNQNKVQVFSINNELTLIREHQAYTFNGSEFIVSKELSAVLGEEIDLEQVSNDQYGNVWYIEKGKVGIFRTVVEEGKRKYKKLQIEYPFSDPRSIYAFDKNNIFINNGDHCIKVDLELYEKKAILPAQIDRIYSVNDKGFVKNKYLMEDSNDMKESYSCKANEVLNITLFNELRPNSFYKIKGDEFIKDLSTPKYTGSPEVFNNETFEFIQKDFYDQTTSVSAKVKANQLFIGSFWFWLILGFINLIFWIFAFILGYNFKKVRSK